jgi:hypothetical protein
MQVGKTIRNITERRANGAGPPDFLVQFEGFGRAEYVAVVDVGVKALLEYDVDGLGVQDAVKYHNVRVADNEFAVSKASRGPGQSAKRGAKGLKARNQPPVAASEKTGQ